MRVIPIRWQECCQVKLNLSATGNETGNEYCYQIEKSITNAKKRVLLPGGSTEEWRHVFTVYQFRQPKLTGLNSCKPCP